MAETDPHRPNAPAPALAPAIEMRGMTKRFGRVLANDHVDFTANFGEVHALIGENGAGKSTLMSILAGIYQPDDGTVAIAGEPVRLASPRDALKRGIGMVFQHFMLVEPFTVAENVLLGDERRSKSIEPLRTADIERDISELASRYGLAVDPRAYIWQLSVGEQQRVEILRLLHRGARILVLDEPTAVLTPQESQKLVETLRFMAVQGFCVVFISHKLDEVLAVADRVTVLRRGQTVATVEARTANKASLARLMVGRELAAFVEHPDVEPHDPVPLGDTVLAVSKLTANSERGLPALHGVDLNIRSGEVVGLAGVAGNGQRELAEVITGLRHATGGTVTVCGRNLTNAEPKAIAAAGVAHIPEDRLATGLVGTMDLASNVILRTYSDEPIARGPFLAANAIASFADRLLNQYDVKAPNRGVAAGMLSGGNQQKLLIGRELAGEPTVIVAVHPTRGVDVGATETIHQILLDQRRRGAGILLIGEDLDELIALSDRIVVIYDGHITGELLAREATIEHLGLLMTGQYGLPESEAAP